MIKVKFFGMIGVSSGISEVEIVDTDNITIGKLLEKIAKDYPSLSNKELVQSVIFLNKKQILGSKRVSIVLKDGDQLSFLSPSGGG